MTKERQVLKETRSLLELFKARGDLSYRRIHVMPIMRTGAMSFNRDMVGLEDLQVYLSGTIFLAWELKTEKGRLSPFQAARKKELERFGFKYEIIRSVWDAARSLAGFGLTHYLYPVEKTVLQSGTEVHLK